MASPYQDNQTGILFQVSALKHFEPVELQIDGGIRAK